MIPAVILAGGFGTRLQPVVKDRPKPMALIRGRPFLELLLDRLVEQQVTAIVLAVGYKAESISSYFGSSYRGVTVSYSIEVEPLGTGGAVRQALSQVNTPDAIVLNGDTWTSFSIRDMLNAHSAQGAALSMGIVAVADVSRYGAINVESGRVHSIREKGDAGPGFINAGVYLFGARARALLPDEKVFSLEQDFLVPHLAELKPLACVFDPPFIDIGIPSDYQRAQTLLPG